MSTALVTGASSGIGLALARVLARHRHDLVLVARDRERLQALAAELRHRHSMTVSVLPKDLSRPGAPEDIVRQLEGTGGGPVDILVNNAGMIVYGKFAETGWDLEERMISVNLLAMTRLTKLLLPGMVARRHGRILNIGSIGSFVASPLNAVYSATKAYLLSFSEAIAEEAAGTGVTVTAVCPGAVRSELQQRGGMTHIRLLRQGVLEASTVAEYAYRAMMSGKRVAIPGWRTALQIFALRFVPRLWAVRMAQRMLE
jgi:short-subunit dehydrogenase